MKVKRINFMLVTALMAALAIASPARAEEPSREYQVKAAFVYNFIQFVEWPADAFETPASPLVIGVVGNNPFGDALEHAVQGKTLGDRTLVVKHYDHVDDIAACQVLFVGSSDEKVLAQVFAHLQGKSVLSIGESDHFPWAGGIIRFYNEDNKVRFEINVQAAEDAKLKISSKLLRLARIFKK